MKYNTVKVICRNVYSKLSVKTAFILAILLQPCNAFAQYYQPSPPLRYAPPTAVGQILEIINGSLGNFLVLAFALLAIESYAMGKSTKDEEQRQRGIILISLSLLLYCARTAIRYYYFGDTYAVRLLLDNSFDVAVSVLTGSLLLGLPCVILGIYTSGAVKRFLLISAPGLLSEEKVKDIAQSRLFAFLLWTLFCAALLSFGWYAYLSAFFCFLLGCLSQFGFWPTGFSEETEDTCNRPSTSQLLYSLITPLVFSLVLGLLIADCFASNLH